MNFSQYTLPLPHKERLTAEDFMVTSSNSEAAAWVERWPDWPSHCLIVCGPSGSGKTHLIEVWRHHSHAVSFDVESFSKWNDRSHGNVIVIDNADKVAGNSEGEEALFHLFNRLREEKGFLLLTARTAPAQWGLRLPDLRSRLNAIPSIALQAPDDALIGGLLLKQLSDRQLQVEAGVIDFILPRIERSADFLRKFVAALDQASLATGRGITIALVRKLLTENTGENFRKKTGEKGRK